MRKLTIADRRRRLWTRHHLGRPAELSASEAAGALVAPVDRIPTLHAAAGWRLLRRERRRNLQLLEKAGIADPEAWIERVAEETLAALADWLGDTRITPRFRTPLEKELST